MSLQIAFLGMGIMGSRMSRRLLAAGHALAVWNRSTAPCQPLLQQGANLLTPDTVPACQIIALCLADDKAVEQVASRWFGQHGERIQPGQVVVDFSSGSPELARRWSTILQKRNAYWIDAPVSGGAIGAETGQLVIFAGGDATVISQLQPLWEVISQRITRMGSSGSGQVAKLCNQLIVAANSALIAEAVHLAQSYGMDASMLAPALAGGFADSKPLQILAPRMAAGQFEPLQWKVKTLLKDLDNVAQLANRLGLELPVSAQARQVMEAYTRGDSSDNAETDLATLIRYYHKMPDHNDE